MEVLQGDEPIASETTFISQVKVLEHALFMS